ncbi:hypothetical protein JHK84_050636 [Glycine max]|nr:hypothetical protein JHK84_050636 [Glycine max]
MGDIYCDVAVAATFRGDIQSARKRENKKGKEGNCHHQMVSDQSYNPLSSTMVVRTNFCYVLEHAIQIAEQFEALGSEIGVKCVVEMKRFHGNPSQSKPLLAPDLSGLK